MDVLRKILIDTLAMIDRPLDEIEEALRAEYGGGEIYIPGDARRSHAYLSRRDGLILADWRRGESVALLARRYSISRQRVYQIIHRDRKL